MLKDARSKSERREEQNLVVSSLSQLSQPPALGTTEHWNSSGVICATKVVAFLIKPP